MNKSNVGSSWEDLSSFAPHTKLVFEYAQKKNIETVSRIGIPDFLILPEITPYSDDWSEKIGRNNPINQQITHREVLLRYLLGKAIVDQGSDTPGIQQWYEIVVRECYTSGIQFIHHPEHFVQRYSEVIEIAHSAAAQVTDERIKSGHICPSLP